MANLADTISAGIKDAMRAKDRERLSALRDIKSKILLEATKEGAGDTVDDATTLAILSKLLKQRNETAALYTDQDEKTWLPRSAPRLERSRPPAALTS